MTLWGFGGLLGNYLNVQKVPPQTNSDHRALPEACNLSRDSGRFLDLKVDLNVVGIPVRSTPALTSHTLLLYLREKAGGDAGVVESIRHYDGQSGTWETASWIDGEPAGVNFPVDAGEAYLIYMRQDMNEIWFDGIAHGAAVDLSVGLNLVGLPAVKEPFEYSSYEMLEDLGDETQVSGMKRYDFTQGWQSTSWFHGSAAGVNYNTSRVDGYLIYMNQETVNWRPY
jgi:hypothetical protein